MQEAATGPIVRKTQCLRKLQRTRTFAAGLLARNGHLEPLNCLIRDLSPGGAQIRFSAAHPIPSSGYLINLKTRSAFRARAVWQRGSLSGLSLGEEHAINDLLPADLKFLRSFFIEAKLRQVEQLTSQGMSKTAALRRFGITADLYHKACEIFSP